MKEIQYEAVVQPGKFEDSRRSMSCDVFSQPDNEPDPEFFVELKSWVEEAPGDEGHQLLKSLVGKKIKITITVMES